MREGGSEERIQKTRDPHSAKQRCVWGLCGGEGWRTLMVSMPFLGLGPTAPGLVAFGAMEEPAPAPPAAEPGLPPAERPRPIIGSGDLSTPICVLRPVERRLVDFCRLVLGSPALRPSLFALTGRERGAAGECQRREGIVVAADGMGACCRGGFTSHKAACFRPDRGRGGRVLCYPPKNCGGAGGT